MADDPKQRDRNSGSQKPPDRERNSQRHTRRSGSHSAAAPEPITGPLSLRELAEREHAQTGFDAPTSPRARVSGSHPSVPTSQSERVTGSHAAAPSEPRERVTQKMFPTKRVTGPHAPPSAVSQPTRLTDTQKNLLSSAFQDDSQLKALKAAVGNTQERSRDDDDDSTTVAQRFDGRAPAPELTARDVFKAVQAPVQSREGRRSKSTFQQVLNQFAVGNNPRYQPDAGGPSRAHIFIWDVSRAMNCEIPHFVGSKELSLGQTCDWLRHEGPVRGWRRASLEDAVAQAQSGLLVVALPKEVRIKQMGVVLPVPPDPDKRPRLAAAAVKVGNNLSQFEALGVYTGEYFVHS